MVLLLAACGSDAAGRTRASGSSAAAASSSLTAASSSSDGTPTSSPPAPYTSPAPPPSTTSTLPVDTRDASLMITDADNGGTVRAKQGTVVELVLGSVYWQIAGSSDPSVLRANGDPTSTRGDCGPGEGCGTSQQSFVAAATGSAVLTASRTTCGEALACSPDKQHFTVTVIVE